MSAAIVTTTAVAAIAAVATVAAITAVAAIAARVAVAAIARAITVFAVNVACQVGENQAAYAASNLPPSACEPEAPFAPGVGRPQARRYPHVRLSSTEREHGEHAYYGAQPPSAWQAGLGQRQLGAGARKMPCPAREPQLRRLYSPVGQADCG